MALFHVNPMFAGDPSLVVVAGSFVLTNTAAAAINTVVPSTLFKASANAGGAALGQNETVAPQGAKVTGVINPTPAYHPAVATGCNANMIMLDLRAYPADIVSVTATAVSPANATAGAINPSGFDVCCLGIDQTNNFIYFLMATATGSAVVAGNGIAIHYQVYFKDGYAP